MQTDCDLIGVNTALVPLVSSLQVSLALHYLVDRGSIDFDHLITVDNWEMTQHKFRIKKSPHCQVCQAKALSLSTPDDDQLRVLCGTQTYTANLKVPGTVEAAKQLLTAYHVPFNRSKNFIQFKWQGISMSFFENGRLLLYGIADLEAANQFYQQFKTALIHYQEVQPT